MTSAAEETGSPSASAAGLIAERGLQYGHVRDNFQRIAALLNAVWRTRFADGHELHARDVAQMMRLVKESRLAESPSHFDSLADICAYADLQHAVTRVMPVKKANPEPQPMEYPDLEPGGVTAVPVEGARVCIPLSLNPAQVWEVVRVGDGAYDSTVLLLRKVGDKSYTKLVHATDVRVL